MPNPWVILGSLVGVLVISAASAYGGWSYENAQWSAKWSDEQLQISKTEQAITDEDIQTMSGIQDEQHKSEIAYETRLNDANTEYNAVVSQLRDANNDRSRLKAAASAPAQCSGYAAPPTELSVPDASVALGISKDGDDAIIELGACQDEYQSLVDRLNAE